MTHLPYLMAFKRRPAASSSSHNGLAIALPRQTLDTRSTSRNQGDFVHIACPSLARPSRAHLVAKQGNAKTKRWTSRGALAARGNHGPNISILGELD